MIKRNYSVNSSNKVLVREYLAAWERYDNREPLREGESQKFLEHELKFLEYMLAQRLVYLVTLEEKENKQ